ncbi:MAG TPA: histidine phosphotransferase family protein [Acetobacteraceae bacterium]|jgi:histidine phosphotransferase ChpT|nr:histidine phosphotransferase family protein [Acetobacteraceae bacterium]
MAAPNDASHLAELLCARISHDLGGMIGTLAGALDLTDDPSVSTEALALARQAAAELRQHLQLQRASWGPATAPLSLPGLRSLMEGQPTARRCRLELDGLPVDTVFAPSFGRAVLNLLMLSIEALNGTGTVTLTGSATDLVVVIAGPRAAWPAGLAACLAAEESTWATVHDPSTLQMPLTVLLARALGLHLSLLLPGGASPLPPPLRLQKV